MEWISDERIGQYITKINAWRCKKQLQRETGRTHQVVETVTYRDGIPKKCYTVKLFLSHIEILKLIEKNINSRAFPARNH